MLKQYLVNLQTDNLFAMILYKAASGRNSRTSARLPFLADCQRMKTGTWVQYLHDSGKNNLQKDNLTKRETT